LAELVLTLPIRGRAEIDERRESGLECGERVGFRLSADLQVDVRVGQARQERRHRDVKCATSGRATPATVVRVNDAESKTPARRNPAAATRTSRIVARPESFHVARCMAIVRARANRTGRPRPVEPPRSHRHDEVTAGTG
jgi:hypothetical protein